MEEHAEKMLQSIREAIAIIKKKHNVKIKWEEPTKQNESTEGTIECPVCKGTLHYSISSYNGHIWGACETEKCLQWMM